MKIIEFRDNCVITRDNGGRDEWDNPIDPDVIYSGPCLFQEGGASHSGVFITRAPLLFIPGVDAQVNINDAVTIETEFGREIESVVKVVREANLPWQSGLQVTRIELKQAQGD